MSTNRQTQIILSLYFADVNVTVSNCSVTRPVVRASAFGNRHDEEDENETDSNSDHQYR